MKMLDCPPRVWANILKNTFMKINRSCPQKDFLLIFVFISHKEIKFRGNERWTVIRDQENP